MIIDKIVVNLSMKFLSIGTLGLLFGAVEAKLSDKKGSLREYLQDLAQVYKGGTNAFSDIIDDLVIGSMVSQTNVKLLTFQYLCRVTT